MKKTLTLNEKKLFEYIIKILASAVNGTKAPLPYEEIDWKKVLYFSKICSINAMVANTVLSLPSEYLPEKEITDQLKQLVNRELLIDGNIAYESEKILRIFDKYKIKNLPLKGYFMKEEYPRPDFRSVCDFDILFDREQADDLKKAFESIGYKFLYNDDTQYHFQKKPYMYIEMHASLVHENDRHYSYLTDQLDRTEKRPNYDYSYQMSIEDYYLFMLIHHSNHFRIGGMGLRMMLDIYLYHKNHKDEFNYDYLNQKLKQYGLSKFERTVREIAYNWFANETPKLKFNEIETYILLSATMGRVDTAVMILSQKSIRESEEGGKKKSKFSYLMKSFFPPKSKMAIHYPYLEKYPFLLPWTWFSMWFSRFFIYKNLNVKRGIRNRMSYTDDDVSYLKGILNEVEFDDFN